MNEEIKEYDNRNNLIHYKNSDGDEYWYEYDENNNEIHFKDSDGYEYWREYDKNNNLIHYKNTKGLERFYKYLDNRKIEISKQEFEQIKRNKVINSYFKNKEVSRFELMDI